MDVYTKFLVTCEKKDKSLIDKILGRKKIFEVWAPCIINWFRDKINTEVYRILSIKSTKDKMEVFGGK